MDVCALFGESVTSTFLKVFAPDLKQYSNVFQKCPISVSVIDNNC